MTTLRVPDAPPLLRDGRVLLRSPRPTDKSIRLMYGVDAEYARMVGEANSGPLSMADVHRWYDWLTAQSLGWVIDIEGRMIGEARIHHINHNDRRGRFAIGIFDPARRGKGIGSTATRLVLQYAFEAAGFHRIDLRVLAYNGRAIAVYERCGFIREGVERESAFVDGRWHDDVMMSILEHEWKHEGGRAGECPLPSG